MAKKKQVEETKEDQAQVEEPKEVEPKSDKSLDEAANVRYLEADDFVLMRTASGALRMTLKDDKSILRVKARRCFPFAFPTRYVSIRDGADQEVGIIRDIAALDKDYRRWIIDELEMGYFTPRVRSIKRITHRYGGVEWYVETDRGSKKIITKGVHDTMTEVEPLRYIITDVDGNRYEIHHSDLDAPSAAMLERLI